MMTQEQQKLIDCAYNEWDSFPKELKVYHEYSSSLVDLLDYLSPEYKIPFVDKRDIINIIHSISIGHYEVAISDLKTLKDYWKSYNYKKLGALNAEIKALKNYLKK